MNRWVIWLMLLISPFHAQELNVIENKFIKIITAPEGFDHPRFSIETTGGDPSRRSDDQLPLIYGRPKPWTSYTTIAIDDKHYGFGTQTLKRAGKNARYGQVLSTSITKNAIVSVSKSGPITATQRLSFFRNPLTNVNDAVLIEYHLINDSKTTKNVGIRIMMDTMLGKNDAAPFRIGNDAVIAEKSYEGDEIMDYWQSFDSLVSPNIIAQGLLRYTPASLTPPDQLILMNWGSLADHPYQVTVTDGQSFIRDGEDEPDTAVALLYKRQLLGPKKSRVYRTVMGLGGVSLTPGELALGLTLPYYIAVTDPNTYTMVAYISNTGGFEVNNAISRVELPKGMVMVSGSHKDDLGTILPGGSRQLVYRLKMKPSEASEGEHLIRLTVSSDTLDDQVLERKVILTGQPSLEVLAVGEPKIQRGMDPFVDVAIEIINPSNVSVAGIELTLDEKAPFKIPSFEGQKKKIPILDAKARHQVSWVLKVDEWHSGTHQIPVKVTSDYTEPITIDVPVKVTLGKPKARLYYSEASFFVNDYGYIWMTLMDMPTFSGLNLRMTWDPYYLKPIRVSPEPWLIESLDNPMGVFDVTNNAMALNGLTASAPPWRMIIGKWHFKVMNNGNATVTLWQGDHQLDQVTLVLREKKAINKKEEDDFDF